MPSRKWVILMHILVVLLTVHVHVSLVNADFQSGLCSAESVVELSRDYGLISGSAFTQKTNKPCGVWHIKSPILQKVTAKIVLKGFDKEACSSGYALQLGPDPFVSACDLVKSNNETIMYRSSVGEIWVVYLQGSVKRLKDPDFLLEYVTDNSASCKHYCIDGSCVLDHWLCNGVKECDRGEDEQQCLAPANTVTSSPVIPCVRCYLNAAQGVVCVPMALLCDGRSDCSNGQDEDEAFCSNLRPTMSPRPIPTQSPQVTPSEFLEACAYGEIYCQQVNQSQYSCLHNALKCDGVAHCSQGQDEDPAICGPTQLCNRRLDDSWGWFASPLYPQPYPPNSNCSWVIHQLGTPGGTVIQLRVVKFTLSMTDQDVLTIFDGPDSSYAVLGSYSKLKTPPSLIESSGSWLNVVFHSKSGYSVPGFNFTYQLKGVCLPDQHRCRMENDCYSEQQRCNGVWDCPVSGIDELECPNCQYRDQHYCGLQTQCYKFSERCNGIAKCPNYADENGCSPNQCGSQNGTFLCDNRRCIYESWTCDHHDDCGDMSDEQNCSGLGTTKRVIIAAICGSMICALLLVILVGCSCKLYSLRTMDYSHHPRHESPMSRLYAELLRRRAPPPYHEAMLTSRNFDEVQQEYMEQLRNAASRRAPRGGSGRGNRRRSSRVRQDSGSNESVENSGDNPNQGINNEGDNSNYASNSLQLCSIHEENETETLDHNGNESSTSTADLLPSDSESDYTDSGEDIDSNVDYHLQGEGNSGESGINANGLDNQGVDNDGENDDGDDDNILNSESLSARWQRNVDSDDTSDEECLLADDFELDRRTDLHIQQGQYNHDCDSLDTEASASILSMDTQETGVQDGDGNKEIDNEVNGESENSRNSTPKPENCHSNLLISGPGESMLMRVHSHSSLNSEGSETYSDSDVPLQRIGSF